MKQAKNNEVDLLLRSLARGRNESSLLAHATPGEELISDHLDADELNSYAEGVMPSAARLRYSEHLADCDACRGMVVSLTQAAGATARYDVLTTADRPGFWQKLGAFFTPAVLRFAVPALVLTAVIGIGLLALRQGDKSTLVARNEPAGSLRPVDQTKQLSETTPTEPSSTTKSTSLPSPTVSDSNIARNNARDEKAAESQAPAGSSGGDLFAGVAPAKDATKAGESEGLVALQPSYSAEPKAAASVSPGAMKTEADSLTMAREQSAGRAAQERQREDAFRNQTSDEHGPNRSAAPNVSGAALPARRLGGPASNNRVLNSQDKKEKLDDRETRSVSGRRFARDGDTWIDTAYDPSRAMIYVARGSEQFRALVADEPGLRAIAQQLNGVVIVVWKNRAYRIQ